MIDLLLGDRYRILRKLGEGGMAVVYLAIDEKLQRNVAIKVLREKFQNNSEVRTRFQHEARAISSFDHPNILKVFDYSGPDSNQLWIVTELIHGRNLGQIVETAPGGWLHPVIASCVVRETAKALSLAHAQGVVHRDVKPDNVMITQVGVVKLMDFGIAKIKQNNSMTQTGMFMGSPSYMSSEQVRGKDVDHRSDIYSLGVLFYELVTGKLPFAGNSTADVAMKILSGMYQHPKFLKEHVPIEINDLIISMMALDPANRPQSTDSVSGIIDRFLEHQGFESSTAELERCFRDPRQYGERLAKLSQQTMMVALPTALVPSNQRAMEAARLPDAGGDNITRMIRSYNEAAIDNPQPYTPSISFNGQHPAHNQGATPPPSSRKDHKLPKRATPHLGRKPVSPEVILNNLPERRDHGRQTQSQQPMQRVHPNPVLVSAHAAQSNQAKEAQASWNSKKQKNQDHNYHNQEMQAAASSGQRARPPIPRHAGAAPINPRQQGDIPSPPQKVIIEVKGASPQNASTKQRSQSNNNGRDQQRKVQRVLSRAPHRPPQRIPQGRYVVHRDIYVAKSSETSWFPIIIILSLICILLFMGRERLMQAFLELTQASSNIGSTSGRRNSQIGKGNQVETPTKNHKNNHAKPAITSPGKIPASSDSPKLGTNGLNGKPILNASGEHIETNPQSDDDRTVNFDYGTTPQPSEDPADVTSKDVKSKNSNQTKKPKNADKGPEKTLPKSSDKEADKASTRSKSKIKVTDAKQNESTTLAKLDESERKNPNKIEKTQKLDPTENVDSTSKPLVNGVLPSNATQPGAQKQTAAFPSGKPSSTETKSNSKKGTANIQVSSSPAARIFINRKFVGTTNDRGSSSEWIAISSGKTLLELKREGYAPKTESLNLKDQERKAIGPFILEKMSATNNNAPSAFRVNVTSNLTPAEVYVVNIETRATVNFSLRSSAPQSVSLAKGTYDITVDYNGEVVRRRVELNNKQTSLTFNAEFKKAPNSDGSDSSPGNTPMGGAP